MGDFMLANQIRNRLQEYLPQMLELLQNLVDRNTSSDYKPGVDAVGEKMAEEFEKIGYSIEFLKNENCGNGVIASCPGNQQKVLLICHLDSVFASGTEQIQTYRQKGNLAYGNGVVDMKACLVNCLYALKVLKELKIPNMPTITVLMSGDEEKGSLAVLDRICQEGKKADWCLVTEGSRPGMAVVTQRKGNAYLHLHAHGRAAHAGNEPQIGRNTIDELALKIVKLRELNDFNVGTTFTVTKISGGQNRIIVPEDASLDADIRFYTMEEWEKISQQIKQILSRAEIDGIQLDYELTFNRPPLTLVDGSATLQDIVIEASHELDIAYLTTQPGGVSDGNFVSAQGTPTIDGMGPTGGMMCSPEEFLEIDTMVPCASRLALTIAKLGAL